MDEESEGRCGPGPDDPTPLVAEESLDPEDWDALAALGHRMVDDMFAYLRTLRDRPAWQPVPEEVRARLAGPLPLEPEGPEQAYMDFLRDVLPYPMGNVHPRYWAWVEGTGTALGALADLLAAAINSDVGGGEHAPVYVERQVVDWCRQIFGFPAGVSGLLTSGTSMATLIALTVARNALAGYDVRALGLRRSPRELVIYTSTEAHSSVEKAVEILGLGREALRRVPVNEAFQIDLEALERAIRADRRAGRRPFCVVGCAGTVNTGAFDDLAALADLCDLEGLWFHVDGAFGAWAALSPALRHLTAGIERADSLAFDFHKWMYVPYEAGCVLIRSEEEHRRAFANTGSYLEVHERGVAGGPPWFCEYGVQMSRGFRALKVWMSLKAHGIQKYARLIEQNVRQAQRLAARIASEPELELLAPVPLNVVCFRYAPKGMDAGALDSLNRELLVRLQESGAAVPSSTVLQGRYCLRVAVTNHRSRAEDFDMLVDEVLKLGRCLTAAVAGAM